MQKLRSQLPDVAGNYEALRVSALNVSSGSPAEQYSHIWIQRSAQWSTTHAVYKTGPESIATLLSPTV